MVKKNKSEDTCCCSSNSTTIFGIIQIVLLVIIIVLLGAQILGTNNSSNTEMAKKIDKIDAFFAANVPNYGSSETTTAPAEKSDATTNVLATDIVIGDANAKVTIIEYSDPSCPYCGAVTGGNKQAVAYLKQRDSTWEPAIPGIIKNYVETGKAKFVFRYFPGHGKGVESMKMLLCANEQNKFLETHDALFENQELMENDETEKLLTLVREIVPNKTAFNTCIEEDKYAEKLVADTNLGRAANVQGTPGFFINGIEVSGAQSYSVFEKIIDTELAQ
jgi:protein-disulfide isomerase